MQPESLGRFDIEGILGEGGMGTVFAARDTDSGDRVALKVLSGQIAENEEKLRRFEQEAAALSRIDHEGIVRRLGPIERDGTRVFFALELIEGDTLARRLREVGPMPAPVALGIARDLLDALSAAHEAGVIHRDIKPSNILLVGDRVKVTDFGLAHMDDITRLTQTGQLMGTLDYMSPEQCEGTGVSERSDLYSVGVVLYEMLAGSAPFRNMSPGAVLKGHLQDVPPRLDKIRADLPEGLAFIVAKLLEKRPEDRFGSAQEALEALAGVRDPARTVTFHAGSGPTMSDLPAPPRMRRRIPWRIPTLGVALILVALASYFAVRHFTSRDYPGRFTPEDVLETVHRSIESLDYDAFADCLEAEALQEYLSEQPERAFRQRAKGIVDRAYRAEVPNRGPGKEDMSIRVVSGVALPAILGRKSRNPMVVAFRHDAGEFRIARVFEDRSFSRREMMGELFKRERRALDERVAEILENLEEYGPDLVDRLEKDGRLPDGIASSLKSGLAAQAASGEKIDYRILHEDSTYDFRRSVVVLESKALAKAFALRGKRVAVEFHRRPRDRNWQVVRIRPVGR